MSSWARVLRSAVRVRLWWNPSPHSGKLGSSGGGFGVDLVAQRFEQPADQCGAVAGSDRADLGLERQGVGGQLRSLFVPSGEGAAEDLGDRDAEVRGGAVGPVVHVFLQQGLRGVVAGPAAAGQPDRVDLQHHCGGAAFCGRLRVEDVGAAEGQFEGLQLVGVLLQKIAQVGGGWLGGGDGEQGVLSPVPGCFFFCNPFGVVWADFLRFGARRWSGNGSLARFRGFAAQAGGGRCPGWVCPAGGYPICLGPVS